MSVSRQSGPTVAPEVDVGSVPDVARDNPGDCRIAGRCCRLVGPEVVGDDFVGRKSGGCRL